MENSLGDFAYFGELRVNARTYKIEWISYKLYTETEANDFTKPSSTWSFPNEGNPTNITLMIPNNNFGNIVGFEPDNFPSIYSIGYDITTSSTKAPNLQSHLPSSSHAQLQATILRF